IMMSCQYLLLLLLSVGVSAVEVQRPRGVPLSKRQFYEEGNPFTCLDGSRTIPFDRVNDDYCDCQDGSDEPGTAACPNGSFHCTNAGFRPGFIPSSRINDGICDCCDTTDEYNSGAACQNTCREMGRKERESMQKMAEIAKEGFMLKQQLIQESKRGLEDKKAKHADIEVSKNELEKTVEALRTVKETAEQPEKEAKERHLKAWEDQKALIQMEKDKARMAEVFLELDDDGLLGGVDQVDSVAFESIWHVIKEKYISEAIPEPPAPVETPPEEIREPESDNDSELYPEEDIPDEEEDDEEEDEDDDTDDGDFKVSPLGFSIKLMLDDSHNFFLVSHCYLSSICRALLRRRPKKRRMTMMRGLCRPTTKKRRASLMVTRDAFEEAEKALREVDDQIKNLEKEISFDFGPTAEFAYLYSQCYELTTSEYIYRLCPFNRVSQKPKFGGSETNLGSWGQWAGPEDNIYSVMKYDHGTGCWQGPNRSTTIKVTCGKETVLVSTSEPSRCEYLMEFISPAVCQEPSTLDSALHDHTEL
uniref:Glucosidase 2 subunit beta n=1 Tax=Cyclopterus lumpus TaxID=8103 RepID=A0A8C3AEG3_CYCLU